MPSERTRGEVARAVARVLRAASRSIARGDFVGAAARRPTRVVRAVVARRGPRPLVVSPTAPRMPIEIATRRPARRGRRPPVRRVRGACAGRAAQRHRGRRGIRDHRRPRARPPLRGRAHHAGPADDALGACTHSPPSCRDDFDWGPSRATRSTTPQSAMRSGRGRSGRRGRIAAAVALLESEPGDACRVSLTGGHAARFCDAAPSPWRSRPT